jgi:predicted ATPase
MIRELYIDNFRCLVNFKIEPDRFQLWLGDNGSGKSSVLDALRSIQRVVNGDHISDVFPADSRTAWETRPLQSFRVVMPSGKGALRYDLSVDYRDAAKNKEKRRRIARESLTWNDETFYLFDGGEAHLYGLDAATHRPEENARFSADEGRSVIPSVAEREDNYPLTLFREQVRQWLIVQPIPTAMSQYADTEARTLSRHAENFANWYWRLSLEKPGIGFKARDSIREVLPGFEELAFRDSGDSKKLRATFRIDNKDRVFDFADLSDGQRQIVVLYTLLEALRSGLHPVLFIDEPDNFVSLREIEPWLEELRDICDEENRQAILISHHPSIVNRMAHGGELWFSRREGAHVDTRPFPITEGLTPAETLERGWDDE